MPLSIMSVKPNIITYFFWGSIVTLSIRYFERIRGNNCPISPSAFWGISAAALAVAVLTAGLPSARTKLAEGS
jgi:hypothetical protein